jgi:BirA family biotin operon repressor/biotin-[acetyl-CoA-carboxylase] ligase
MPVGSPHRHFREVGSTNEVARELAASGAADGTVVTAEGQTDGRGRQGRAWSTPAGSALAWSLLLRRRVEVPGTLPLQIGVAVCEVVEHFGVERAEVKWPNDVWIDGRKCAGILVEARPQDGWAVVGVGLNLSVPENDFPEELRPKATSVGHGADVPGATAALNHFVARRLEADIKDTLAELSDRDALRGRRIRWATPTDEGAAAATVAGRVTGAIESGAPAATGPGAAATRAGIAAGIDASGNLLVETGDGIVSLNAGEVHLDVGT